MNRPAHGGFSGTQKRLLALQSLLRHPQFGQEPPVGTDSQFLDSGRSRAAFSFAVFLHRHTLFGVRIEAEG